MSTTSSTTIVRVASERTTIDRGRKLAAAYFDRSRGEPPPGRDEEVERGLFVELVGDRARQLDGAGPREADLILGRLYREHLLALGLVGVD